MKRISTVILLILAINCNSQNLQSDTIFSKMFWLASGKFVRNGTTFQTISTSPMYVVITVTDLKTNQTKEICTEYNFIEGAIDKDSGNAIVDIKNRIFKFKSDEALDNVGFKEYDTLQYKTCTNGITANILLNEWRADHNKFQNKYSGDCQIYYAYLLFKNGIMSRRGCIVGDLSIVDEKEMNEIENRIKNPKK